ncbi:hypothetical protein JKP88DRAFT_176004 [Tribonema minus]|uniref:Treble clef zinc finger domain-containing protein n=1 Tax=Tribonema minus TaxID=303371 RepID=A0A835ZJG7_9STRA|nr:hypothetical protein JKP88DRAFT_176004 [Tribonema minus]
MNTLTLGSTRKLHFKCPSGHVYGAVVSNRVSGSGCNICAGHGIRGTAALLVSTSLYKEIDWIACVRNGIHTPRSGVLTFDLDLIKGIVYKLTAGSNVKLYWRCKDEGKCGLLKDDPIYTAVDFERCKAKGITREFIDTLTLGSAQKLVWKCSTTCLCPEHEWFTRASEHQRYGCPYCSKRYVCPCSSLQALFPHVAAQLHPCNNVDPRTIASGSPQLYKWICTYGCDECDSPHVWTASAGNRTSGGSGCPWCAGKKW